VIADLDGNGALDLAVANSADANVSVRLNAGDGTFASSTTLGLGLPLMGTPPMPTGLRVGDFDHDGRPDLVTANDGAGSVAVLFNTTP
jgi:hypothetical protein